MAVAWFRNPVLEDDTVPIKRGTVNEHTFGVADAKRHPAYVYGASRQSALMHRVARVRLHWYAVVSLTGCGSHIARLKQPAMVADTVCGQFFALTPKRSRTCHVPLPNSVLCGRCHGEPATFGKHGAGTKVGLTRRAAGATLGCEVNGYPSALAADMAAASKDQS